MEQNIIFWNPWWKNHYKIEVTKRPLFDEIISLIERKEILFLTGIRRSGKTSAFYYIINSLLENNTPSENIFYLNLDDEAFLDKSLNQIYQTYKQLFPKIKGKTYLFLDEIQNCENWERFVKTIYDSHENIKIFISGSNAHLLQKKSSTLLTGRMLTIDFFPLSFKEYLTIKSIPTDNSLDIYHNQNLIIHEFENFLLNGGFPEVVFEQDQRKKYLLLKTYFENIRDKDIIKTFGIREIKKFERLTLFLLSNISRFISSRKLSSSVDLSAEYVNNYIDNTEQVYLFFSLRNFSYSIKGQITSQRKIYSIDTGIVNALSFNFSKEYGRILENMVFLELKKKGYELYYYRDTQECDFIIKQNTTITQAIQVTQSIEDEQTKQREVKGLLKAIENFNVSKGLILTQNEEDEIVKDNITIKVLPVWKWVLTNL